MAKIGFPSEAHVYDRIDACIYCGMYRVNVERMSHACKAWREAEYEHELLTSTQLADRTKDLAIDGLLGDRNTEGGGEYPEALNDHGE
jgi:hypothetical protein